ncbi:hypothetical protein AAMO2058_001064200 [Amorphochlora amoebiformis]
MSLPPQGPADKWMVMTVDSDSTKSLFNRTSVDVKVPNDQGNEETLNIQATLTERLLVVEAINKVTHDKFGRNFEMGDLKALGFQGKPIHFFNMLTDSLKLQEDGKSDPALKCYIRFGEIIPELKDTKSFLANIGGFKKLNPFPQKSNGVFIIVELNRYGEESWALPLSPVSVSEIEKLRLQVRDLKLSLDHLQKNATPRASALATIQKLIDTLQTSEGKEDLKELDEDIKGMPTGMARVGVLLSEFEDSGLEKIYRFQARLFGWTDVLKKMRDLKTGLAGKIEPLIYGSLGLTVPEIAGFRKIFKDFTFGRLLYKKSRDGDSFSSFKTKVCGQGAVAVFIKLNKRFLFGGMTKAGFENKGRQYVNDPQAFLFSLRNSSGKGVVKLPVKNNGTNATYTYNNYFAFGGGHDLCIYLGGGGSNYSNLSNTYDSSSISGINKKDFLAGGYNFSSPKEILVYKVKERNQWGF